MKRIKVAQFGLGPIGVETLRLAATKPWLEVVGGVDVDPGLVGRTLAEIVGIESFGSAKVCRSFEELSARADLVFHTAVSRLRDAAVQIEPMLRAGVSVISSCEELIYPARRDPALAAKLDQVARDGGARVLGVGVNPGFVMDVLPLCLTGVCRMVQAIHVERVVNASTRRGPLQKKIGSGLPPAEFERLFEAGKAGHAGLQDSAALLAHGLGWTIEKMVETGKAVLAPEDIATAHVQVKAGQTRGLHQRVEAMVGGRVALTLDLQMYLDAPNPHDACRIEGDPPLDLLLTGGVAGDAATVAALVNAAPRLMAAPPGLLLLTDITLPKLAA